MNKILKDLIKVDLTKNQKLALESFILDRGEDIFKNSTLLKVINKGDLDAVPNELAKWIVDNGRRKPELIELRQKEIALFTK